jgi:hypothetical protein
MVDTREPVSEDGDAVTNPAHSNSTPAVTDIELQSIPQVTEPVLNITDTEASPETKQYLQGWRLYVLSIGYVVSLTASYTQH